MKKTLLFITSILIILIIVIGGLLLSIRPTEDLTLDYEPIAIEDKVVNMISTFNTDIRLSADEIDSLVKQAIDPQYTEQIYIDGAHFYVENNQLHGKLNVEIADRIPAELNVVYDIGWEEPNLVLTPVSLAAKKIKLSKSLLSPISVQIYHSTNSPVKITSIASEGNELIVKWKLSLFQ